MKRHLGTDRTTLRHCFGEALIVSIVFHCFYILSHIVVFAAIVGLDTRGFIASQLGCNGLSIPQRHVLEWISRHAVAKELPVICWGFIKC